MSFVNFAEVKASRPIESLVEHLGLKMTKKKGEGSSITGHVRPATKAENCALVVASSKSTFYCSAGQTGGDAIALAAHIRDGTMKQAAHWIAGKGASHAV